MTSRPRRSSGGCSAIPPCEWVGTFDADPWDANWGFNCGRSERAEAATVDGVSRHGRVLDVAFNPDNLDDRELTEAKMGINRLAAFPLMGVPTLEEAWFRYYVYLPADWEAAYDGKMPGLAGNVDVLASRSPREAAPTTLARGRAGSCGTTRRSTSYRRGRHRARTST